MGCSSHRFNLAVNDVLVEYKEILSKIIRLMIKLKTLLLTAKLRQLTPLWPKILNVSRWSSAFEMMHRYIRIREFLALIDSSIINEMMLTVAENRRVEVLVEILKWFEFVTKALQNDTTSVSDLRAIFATIIEKNPWVLPRLSSNARIVHCPRFESDIFKLQRNSAQTLTTEERVSLVSFELRDKIKESSDNESLSIVERSLKSQKTDSPTSSTYIDTQFILATSNICERLFSKWGMLYRKEGNGWPLLI